MKTQPVQPKSTSTTRKTWDQIIKSLARQIMQDWFAEHNESDSQVVLTTTRQKTDRKVQTRNPVA